MNHKYAEHEPDHRVVARFLCEYHKIWQEHFPGLNKRAHWHVIFSARTGPAEGVSCRSIHRTLYGFYGTDIRTCIERIKDCERDGLVRIVDSSNRPCLASPGCMVAGTAALNEAFDRHCSDTIAELRAAFGGPERPLSSTLRSDRQAIATLFSFFGG